MFGRSKSLVPLAASLTFAAVLSSPAFANSLCSDDRATRVVREMVQNAVPEWSVDLAADFGDWARVERVKNLTKVTAVSFIRAVSHDNDTQLTNCIAKVTFALDDHTMSPQISYTVQPLEDKPDALHVDVDPPYGTRVVNRVPAAPALLPAPQTTVVVNNPPAAPAPAIVPVPIFVAPLSADTMSCWDLRIARNEVFARHGYAFKNNELTAYFSRQSWYHPLRADVSTIILSPSENQFIDVVKTAEAKRGCVAP
jgi:hypothetical protein